MDNEIEVVELPDHQLRYLERASRALNPRMPVAFGAPHVIRAILDRFVERAVDLTNASSEGEIARMPKDS